MLRVLFGGRRYARGDDGSVELTSTSCVIAAHSHMRTSYDPYGTLEPVHAPGESLCEPVHQAVVALRLRTESIAGAAVGGEQVVAGVAPGKHYDMRPLSRLAAAH